MAASGESSRAGGYRSIGKVLVCAVDYWPHARGGAEQQARIQAEEFCRLGYEVSVICPRFLGTGSGVVNGVRVIRLPIVPIRTARTITYYASLTAYLCFALRKYDRVFVHLAFYHADIVVLLARIFRRPVWVRVAASGPVGEIQRMRTAAHFTRYFGLRNATWVQAISESIAREALSIGVSPEHLVPLPNGVDVTRFRPADEAERTALRAQLELPPSAVLVLFVGRLSASKGVQDLARAWGSAPSTSDAVAVVVGTYDTLQAIDRLPTRPDFIVRRWASRIEDFYRACDIFVLPSYAEGMSNALLEAMACGLAAIATRVGAAEDMIESGRNGFLIDPGDIDGLRAHIVTLSSDPALRERIGREARRSVAERFGSRQIVARIVERCWAET